MSAASEIAAKVKRAKRVAAPAPTLVSIAGNIVDDGAAALPNVAVTASLSSVTLASTTTDASGDFAFPAGFEPNTTYQVAASLTGYTPDNDPLDVAVVVSNVTDADFVLTED